MKGWVGMKTFCVYKHTNKINNKVYIGITSRKPEIRWGPEGKNYIEDKSHFGRAIKKYGWNNFEHTILYEGLSEEDACNKEQELILEYQSFNNKYGYNRTMGGDKLVKYTKESKEYLSKRIKESFKRPDVKEKLNKHYENMRGKTTFQKGIPRTDEEKRNISIGTKKAMQRPEVKAKTKALADSRRGKPSGYHHSEEEIVKIRERMLGENNPTKRLEVRQKISASCKGRVPWNKGKQLSEETKRKISESQKQRLKEVM